MPKELEKAALSYLVPASLKQALQDLADADRRNPAVQMALRNHAFDSLGLPRLYVPVEAQPVEPPRYVTRMPGGVGGAAP